MNGTPGGHAFFSIGSIKDVPMREAASGRYVTDYTIRRGDDTNGGKPSVRLVTPDGQTFVRQAQQPLVIHTGRPMEPVISAPGPNAPPSDPLVIRGKATPNTQVHVKVDYRNQLLGVLAVQGTAADMVVNVDGNGNWQTPPIHLSSLLPDRGMRYTISATALNAANQSSDTRQVQFRLR